MRSPVRQGGGPAMLPPRGRRRRRLRERRSVQVIAVLLGAALIWLAWSVGSALTV